LASGAKQAAHLAQEAVPIRHELERVDAHDRVDRSRGERRVRGVGGDERRANPRVEERRAPRRLLDGDR